MKKLILTTAILILTLFVACNDKSDQENNLIVTVKYKTQPNKSVDAVTGLKKLIEEVKKEEHFVKIKMHIDQQDNSNIMLYEVWDDELYYKNQHMKTEHLQKFIIESQSFLAGPPEIAFWKVNAVYK